MQFLDTEIAPLGMGCWPIGGAMYSGEQPLGYTNTDDDASIRTIHAALAAGITLFDTAPAYGAGHAERLLARALKDRPDALIVTKIGIAINEQSKQLIGDEIERASVLPAIERGLSRLGRDRIDLLLLHQNGLPLPEAQAIFDEMEKARQAGKIRYYGWSTDFSERAVLEYVHFEFEPPKFDVEECQQRDMTYAAPLKVKLRLIVFETDEETGAKSVKDIKEQDVYMGDIPLMTGKGTFVINGTERVIVSQMHRSPGVFFDHDRGKTHASGKLLFAARIIPYRGSWLDLEFDAKDIVHVRIDRRRKLPATTLLYALGLDKEQILATFYDTVTYKAVIKGSAHKGWKIPYDAERLRGVKPEFDVVDAKTGDVVAEAGKKVSARVANQLAENGLKELLVQDLSLIGRFVSTDIVNLETGEIFVEPGDELTEELLEQLRAAGIKEIPVLDIDPTTRGPYIRTTLAADKNDGREGALVDVYRVMRPGEPPTAETAENLFNGLFFDGERYDLSSVGRVRSEERRVGKECRSRWSPYH